MNIGIFTDNYTPQISGVATAIDTLRKEYSKMGHNVYIITNKYNNKKDDDPNIFRIASIPFFLDKSCRIGLFYSFKLLNKIKKLDLDIVHTHTEFNIGIFGRIVAKKLNLPLIHTYHTMYEYWVDSMIKNKFIKYLGIELVKNLSIKHCKSCAEIIVPSNKVKNFLKKYNISENVTILPNGIDLKPFFETIKEFNEIKIKNFRKKIGLKQKDKVILNVSRQSKEKNIEAIIKAIKKLNQKRKNIKLLIIGDGPNKKNLEKLSKKLNIKKHVLFLGKQPRKDIEKFYRISDIFITASQFETQGLTVMEAMATEIPVVVKKDKAFEDIIENNINGFVFKEDEKLSNLLDKIIYNNELLNKVKTKAFERVQEYSSENFAKNLEKIYLKHIN